MIVALLAAVGGLVAGYVFGRSSAKRVTEFEARWTARNGAGKDSHGG